MTEAASDSLVEQLESTIDRSARSAWERLVHLFGSAEDAEEGDLECDISQVAFRRFRRLDSIRPDWPVFGSVLSRVGGIDRSFEASSRLVRFELTPLAAASSRLELRS